MRVLITGGGGLLGGALAASAPPGVELHVTIRRAPAADGIAHRLDLSDAGAVRHLLRRVEPQVVLHTAHDMSASAAEVDAVTTHVVREANGVGAGVIHLSTDLVFDGENAPYSESDPAAPILEYGHRKASAERIVQALQPESAVVRTSLLLRVEPPDRSTAWVLEGLRSGAPPRLFSDEIRTPIAADDLAAQLWELALLPVEERRGVWHLVGPEALSRYALGLLIAAHWGLDAGSVVAGRSREAAVPRPRDTRLLTRRADQMLRTRARGASELLACHP